MNKLARVIFVVLVISLVVGAGAAYAITVEKVTPDGHLILADGKQIALAGIRMDAEGASVLRVLAEKQNVRLEILRTVSGAQGEETAYAYLNAKSIPLPFKETDLAGQERILLNRFLIRLGAAKVNEAQEFSKKADFLRIQAEAKRKGEGVWSYVDF